ncbi:unnamed protein product [Rotaria sordida]|uniref:Protein RFT1 homolog n=1 Tax=Rotaria sordida TaxID=392033 RepID=A0A819P995_9BILA|nr:unnamed protein product [Rotaria sordida]CAF4012912.1 unnamed protein product [Rotaria sordida]
MSSNENLLYSLIRSKTILNLNSKLLFGLINILVNGLIIRYVNLNIIGIANIRLKLYYTTILFISRESLRYNIPYLNNIGSIYHYINLIWLIISLQLLIILFFFFLTLFIKTNNKQYLGKFYNQPSFIYILSAFIELLSEPFYLLSRITGNDHIHIYIEFIASTIGIVIQTYLVINNVESSLLYYGFGYLIKSIIITLTYYIYFLIKRKEERYRLFLISSFNHLFIKAISPFVDHKLFNETIQFFKQGISMKILKEGQIYLITIFYLISYEEQAIIHISYLLEDFFPSVIFSTIQQISFNYFHKIFSTRKIDRTMIKTNKYIKDDQILLREKEYNRQISTPNEERTIKLNALTLYNNLIRLILIISLLILTFVIPYSSSIINIYIGSKLSINSKYVLYIRLYLIKIILNGINGISQSFLESIMLIKQLNNYRNILLYKSFIYLLLSYIFIRLFGIIGIIIIDCLYIFGRIIINNYLINKYFIRNSLNKSYLFSLHYIFLLLISLIILNISKYLIDNIFGEISFAFSFIIIITFLTLIQEKQLIHYIYCIIKLNY